MKNRCLQVNEDGVPCIKRLASGLDIHGGGHIFAPPEVEEILASGHYDATALLAGLPATHHKPEDCHPGCPKWTGPIRVMGEAVCT